MNESIRKVLFIAINSSWSHTNLAFYYLREMLADLPYATEISNWTLKDHLQDVLLAIYNANPELLCFSAYIWNRQYLELLIPAARQLLPTTQIVIGGPEAEYFATLCPEPQTTIVRGAGEAVFRSLAECALGGSSEPLANYYKEEHLTLNQLPFPYRASDQAQLQGKLVYYECYRGCPYSCIYCLSATDKRQELRFDPDKPAEVKELYSELDALIELQPKTIKFVDRSFNIHPKLAQLIWHYFIHNPRACEVHFEIYPDLLCEADFALLENAPEGLIRFEIGIQSTDDAIIQNSGRSSNWDKAKNSILQLKQRTKIRLHTDLLMGLPHQNYASVLNSLNELCATLPDAVQLGTLKILPHTPMHHLAQTLGYKYMAQPPYQCLASDALNFAEICKLENMARLLNLYWNKEEFAALWQEMLSQHTAVEILEALSLAHSKHGFELHSLAKAKRHLIMTEVYERYRS